MNLPTILAKTMTKAEKRVGPSVVEVAEQSCRDAIAEEKDLTLSSKRLVLTKLPPNLVVFPSPSRFSHVNNNRGISTFALPVLTS